MASRIKFHSPIPRAISFQKTPRDAERDKFYGGRRWKDLRKAFLAQSWENRLCARCRAEGQTEPTAIVHHIKERTEHPELAYTMSNLEGLC